MNAAPKRGMTGPMTPPLGERGASGAVRSTLRLATPADAVEIEAGVRGIERRHGPRRLGGGQVVQQLVEPVRDRGELGLVRRLVERGDGARGGIEQVDLRRERIAEKARQAQRDIDARPVEHAERHDLEAGHSAGAPVPLRLNAHQGESLGDIVAAGPHVGRPPGRQGHAPRPFAMDLQVTLDQQRRRFPAERPGRRRRHGAGIDRIEIAPGRQHVRPAARRRAGRAGGDEAPVERRQRAGDFGRAAGRDRRGDMPGNFSKHGSRGAPAGLGTAARDKVERQRLQPLDGIAIGAPRRRGGQRGGFGAGPGIAEHAVERIERPPVPGETEIAGKRADQRRVARLSATTRKPGEGDKERVAKAPLRALPEHMEPVADLHFLQLAQVIVELGEGVVGAVGTRYPAIEIEPA